MFFADKALIVRMLGTYHQFGAFVSGVASLPRVVIMTMHDISLKPREVPGGDKGKKPVGIGPDSVLELKGTVKTYRYRDEEDDAAPTTGGATAPGAPAATPPVPGAGAVTAGANKTEAAANQAAGGSR